MVKICKWCLKEFPDNKVNSYCGHSGNCIKNPKSKEQEEKE